MALMGRGHANQWPEKKMADAENLKKVLWMFRDTPPEPEKSPVEFDPYDPIYQLQKNTRNPYLKRAIAPGAKISEQSAADLNRLLHVFPDEGGYEISPTNRKAPFSRRLINHPKPPPTSGHPYQKTSDLSGDSQKLPWLVKEFFKSILERLRKDPGEFDLVVEELLILFRENTLKIKLYQAFYSLEDWDHLMETLDEISHYPSPETFDLFCSALLTYYELVYPPESL